MNLFTVTLATMAVFASSSIDAQTLVITRDGSRDVRQAPAESVTGRVSVEMLFEALNASDASGGSVTFGDDQYNAASPNPQPQPSNPQKGTTGASGAIQQKIAPGLATLTDDVLFGDVWRRPELSPRDRSLVTISVLIATGRTAQLGGHLGRALDNGVQPRPPAF
jgi:alkylhydroperoxidase/carboxymuconolactone decarboxylase family protein YurZ